MEQYCLTVDVEANLTIDMAKTLIFPAAIRYQNELASTCANLKMVGYEFDTDTFDTVTGLVKGLQDSSAARTHDRTRVLRSPIDEARHRCEVVLPSMADGPSVCRPTRKLRCGRLVAATDLSGDVVY